MVRRNSMSDVLLSYLIFNSLHNFTSSPSFSAYSVRSRSANNDSYAFCSDSSDEEHSIVYHKSLPVLPRHENGFRLL